MQPPPAATAAAFYCLWLAPLGGYCGALRPTSFVRDLDVSMSDDMYDDDAAQDAALDYEDEAQLSSGHYYDEEDEEEVEYVRGGTYEGRGFRKKEIASPEFLGIHSMHSKRG